MKKREAYEVEVCEALALCKARFPRTKYDEEQAKAKEAGLKDERCLVCNTTFLACQSFVICHDDDCPIKAEGLCVRDLLLNG